MPGTFADIRRATFPGLKFQEIELQGAHSLRDNISTTNYTVPYAEKVLHAAALLETVRGPGFLFVNLKKTAEEVYDQLTKALPKKTIHLLHGGMEKKDRRKAIARFEDGGDILVCTDIASRGIDIPGLNWVLNYDLPFEPVYYIHRCGRAGRNGAPAEVVNLVTTKDFPLITRINSAIENQSSLKLARVVGKRDAGRKKAASKAKQTTTRKKAARPKAAATPGRAKAKPGKPGRSKSEASRAARAQSKSEKPSRGKPAEGRSGRSQSASAKPARGKTATGKPARSSSPAGKPSRGKPPTGKPSRSRGAAGKPTSRKPTTKSRRKSR
jgi:superfamily II DNA/RNA helicase